MDLVQPIRRGKVCLGFDKSVVQRRVSGSSYVGTEQRPVFIETGATSVKISFPVVPGIVWETTSQTVIRLNPTLYNWQSTSLQPCSKNRPASNLDFPSYFLTGFTTPRVPPASNFPNHTCLALTRGLFPGVPSLNFFRFSCNPLHHPCLFGPCLREP